MVSAGEYSKDQNFGFSRSLTAIPSTDPARMKAFFMVEYNRRSITDHDVRNFRDFGGPLFKFAKEQKPVPCGPKQGVTQSGLVEWTGGPARYVYILPASAPNPLVPPNLDVPKGTYWRLNVAPNVPGLDSAVLYGTQPEGSNQVIPQDSSALDLIQGHKYKLYVLKDVLQPLTNCIFQF